MREIKFKVWDEESKKMYCGYDAIVTFSGFLEEVYVRNKNTVDELIDYKIMQYTGLKDKNGKEIYEGDILKEKHSKYSNKPPKKSYGVIKREGCNCNLYVEWNFQDRYEGEVFWNKDRLSLHCASQYEVIGNVYENSNLLEGNR